MSLTGRLHCPDCQGRLSEINASSLHCTDCERIVQVIDGIADLAGDHAVPVTSPYCYRGSPQFDDAGSDALLARIRAAAGERWPVALGEVLEFGCGRGQLTRALAVGHAFRSLLVLDSAIDSVRTTRERILGSGVHPGQPVLFATLSMDRNAIRDGSADTAIGTALLSGIGDVRSFLGLVHRALKPHGRALFVVPNRRYRQALCQAMAEALIRCFAREGAWPTDSDVVLGALAHARRLLIHGDNAGLLSDQEEKHLFDSEALEDLGREAGFTTAEMIPLDADPAGGDAARRMCVDAGAPDDSARALAPLVASAGRPFFSLLSRQDSSPSMLLWLTKSPRPDVRIFHAQPPPPRVGYAGPDAALGGAAPRWSIEVHPRETPDGIVVSLGGWCLINTDVLWVRLTLDGVARVAPVWRARRDVHEVLNGNHLYHPLNVLCSGIDSELEFAGVHSADHECPFGLEIVLANGLTVSGPAPQRLVMDAQIVITQ